jgi:hypothetical protein
MFIIKKIQIRPFDYDGDDENQVNGNCASGGLAHGIPLKKTKTKELEHEENESVYNVGYYDCNVLYGIGMGGDAFHHRFHHRPAHCSESGRGVHESLSGC